MKTLPELLGFQQTIQSLFDTRDWAQTMHQTTRKEVFRYHYNTASKLIACLLMQEEQTYGIINEKKTADVDVSWPK